MNNKIDELNRVLREEILFPKEIPVQERLFKLTNNIFRYDTFRDDSTVIADLGDLTTARRGPGNSTTDFLNDNFYEELPIYDYKNGRNPHYNYFTKKHRVKLNFYNVDYLIVKTVGVNLKMQTKGWTGVWRKLQTDELRLGFGATILESEIPLNIPLPSPQSPWDKFSLTFEKYSFFNTNDFPIGIPTLNILGNRITQQDLVNGLNDLINDQLKVKAEEFSRKLLKYVEFNLNPGLVEWRNAKFAAFRMLVPEKKTAIVAFSRYEEIKYGDNQINKQFDFGVAEMGLKKDGGNIRQFLNRIL